MRVSGEVVVDSIAGVDIVVIIGVVVGCIDFHVVGVFTFGGATPTRASPKSVCGGVKCSSNDFDARRERRLEPKPPSSNQKLVSISASTEVTPTSDQVRMALSKRSD